MIKKVLITGGTGFVGANLVRHLIAEGYDVHLIVRPSYQDWRIQDIRDKISLHICDIKDANDTHKTIEKIQPQWIFHFAVHGAYSWQKNTHEIINTNLIGTVNLVQACLASGFETFINIGSSSEYGLKNHAPPETELPKPNSDYALGKLAATFYCEHIAESNNVNISTLRLYSVYGAYEERNRLIPQLILHGLKGQLPPLASPLIARDFIYIDDVINACMMIASAPIETRGIYNIGTGQQTTLQDVVDVVRSQLQIDVLPQWGSMPDRDWDTSVWYADITKARQILQWQPRHTLTEGLSKTIAWFRQDKNSF